MCPTPLTACSLSRHILARFKVLFARVVLGQWKVVDVLMQEHDPPVIPLTHPATRSLSVFAQRQEQPKQVCPHVVHVPRGRGHPLTPVLGHAWCVRLACGIPCALCVLCVLCTLSVYSSWCGGDGVLVLHHCFHSTQKSHVLGAGLRSRRRNRGVTTPSGTTSPHKSTTFAVGSPHIGAVPSPTFGLSTTKSEHALFEAFGDALSGEVGSPVGTPTRRSRVRVWIGAPVLRLDCLFLIAVPTPNLLADLPGCVCSERHTTTHVQVHGTCDGRGCVGHPRHDRRHHRPLCRKDAWE